MGTECRMGFTDRDDPVVGYSYLMRISSKIFEGISKAIESLFREKLP